MQASVVQNGAGRLWCRANGHGVQASVVQCIGAAWCWAGVVQGGCGSIVQSEGGAGKCGAVWCRVRVL